MYIVKFKISVKSVTAVSNQTRYLMAKGQQCRVYRDHDLWHSFMIETMSMSRNVCHWIVVKCFF